MTAAYLSASGGDRALACPAAYALDAGPDVKSEAASRGIAIHAYLEALQTTPAVTALAEVPDSVRETCAGITLDEIPLGRAEIGYAYNAVEDTARCLGFVSGRRYPEIDREQEIPMTLDLDVPAEANGGIPMVLDWKTGFESVPRASESMQLALAALAVARVHGVDRVEGAIVRIGSDGALHWDRYMFDWDALEDAAERWRTAHESVSIARGSRQRGHEPSVNPGSYCRYCPARANCPQMAADSREIVAAPNDWLARFESAIADDAGAAEWWAKIARAEEIVKTMRALIDLRAASRPIPLPDGSMVAERVSSRDRIKDASVVHDVLADLYGETVAVDACDREWLTTKARIERAIANHAGKGKLAAEEKRRALKVLTERGGIETRESRVVDVIPGNRSRGDT